MHIYCDESGGVDAINEYFLVASVMLPPNEAHRLVKSFRKATGLQDEIKGHKLSREHRRIFFGLMNKLVGIKSASVVCSRSDMLGGWAMTSLAPHVLWAELIIESCLNLPISSQRIGITPDGGRYKRHIIENLEPKMATRIGCGLDGRDVVLRCSDSKRDAGIQIADIVANTVFQALASGRSCDIAQELVSQAQAIGWLQLGGVALEGLRLKWMADEAIYNVKSRPKAAFVECRRFAEAPTSVTDGPASGPSLMGNGRGD